MLKIATNFSLPTDAVTQTFAILGKRGVGKTHTAVVIVEEMLRQSLPVCVVDPIGVWWGLRSSKDGKRTGFPVVIFGGDKADVPLSVGGGQLIADIVVNDRLQSVLDLSHFRKGEQTRFMVDFAERLYHKNREPLQLVLDEADAFAPQRPMRDQARLLGAMEDIVRRGRARGLGAILATQRPAVLNKNVLTQVEVLVAMRSIAPQDRAAIDAWINVHGTAEQREQLMKSLPSLPIGHAWFWSPGWLDVFKRVKVRERTTYDSSATPKVGRKRKTPTTMAEIDIDAIKAQMSSIVEEEQSKDPKTLKKELARLRTENTALQNKIARLEKHIAKVTEKAAIKLTPSTPTLIQDTKSIKTLEKIKKLIDNTLNMPPAAVTPIKTNGQAVTPTTTPSKPARAVQPIDVDTLGKAESLILRAFFWLQGERATPTKVAFLSGYKAGSGSFNNTLSKLRGAGLLSGWSITPAGVDAVPETVGPRPTGAELREWLRPKLSRAENAILDVVIAHYPDRVDATTISIETSYTEGSGSFNNALSRLRSIEALSGYAKDGGMCASDSFCD